MAAKGTTLSKEEEGQLSELFAQSLNLTGAKAKDVLKKPAQAQLLAQLIRDNRIDTPEASAAALGKLDAKAATLIVAAVTSPGKLQDDKRGYVVTRVFDGSLKSTDQVNAACKYLETKELPVDLADFDKECGVGIVVTPEEVRKQVLAVMDQNRKELDDNLGWGALPGMMAYSRREPALRWAAALDIKNSVEAWLKEQYGDKTAAMAKLRAAQQEAKEREKAAKAAATAKASDPKNGGVGAAAVSADQKGSALPPSAEAVRPDAMFVDGFLSKLHQPGGNPQIKAELRDAHLKATGGRVVTRFPPEPSGELHLGHAKAIAVDFGYAKHHKGLTYLRFDDTNPEAEEQKFFDAIVEVVRWLGYEPFKITYSSDYFDQLYQLAVELIKRDKAYVDHSTPEEIKEERGGEARGPRKESRFRNRPIAESLRDFEDMKNGKYKPGQCTLRMKQDILGNGNPQMWDLIAYRVLDAEHHRTGAKWCIYPTYDFTHCLVDSFENISHSLCTTEFQLSRESYEWLCDALEVYKPRQYEFGRLSLEGTITSKRKLNKLIASGMVTDWDDPRLYTLVALRRRGIPPAALISFVNALGVSVSPALIHTDRFEQVVRQYLEASTPRLMMLLDPIKVVIEDLPEDHYLPIEKPLHPKVPEMGRNVVPFTRTVYIDASDFREVDSKDYFRLAPGKTVGLLNVPDPITAVSYEKDASTGKITLIRAKRDTSGKKPKTYIQWVGEHAASGSPVRIEDARIFQRLFTSANPGADADLLASVNRDSLENHTEAIVETGFWAVAAKAYADAWRYAEERTKEAEKLKAEANKETSILDQLPKQSGEGAPKMSPEQLMGNEVIRFQAMRIGYFTVDKTAKLPMLEGELGKRLVEAVSKAKDDKDRADKVAALLKEAGSSKIVLNRIVSLKEDVGKSGK